MQWLNENDDVSLEFLHGAYARDKKDGVSESNLTQVISDRSPPSSSERTQNTPTSPVL